VKKSQNKKNEKNGKNGKKNTPFTFKNLVLKCWFAQGKKGSGSTILPKETRTTPMQKITPPTWEKQQ
jgi:hypothetical protein